jgi:hypothetical protein
MEGAKELILNLLLNRATLASTDPVRIPSLETQTGFVAPGQASRQRLKGELRL